MSKACSGNTGSRLTLEYRSRQAKLQFSSSTTTRSPSLPVPHVEYRNLNRWLDWGCRSRKHFRSGSRILQAAHLDARCLRADASCLPSSEWCCLACHFHSILSGTHLACLSSVPEYVSQRDEGLPYFESKQTRVRYQNYWRLLSQSMTASCESHAMAVCIHAL